MSIRNIANWTLRLEPLVLAALVYAFWHHTPIRQQWSWLLLLLLPMFGARWILYKRLWTRTPMDNLLLAFLALCIINIYLAPYTRGYIMLPRLLLGLALYLNFVEYARTRGKLDGLLAASVALGILVGLLALTATQWNIKAGPLLSITEHLPVLNYRNFLSDTMASFNPNEIAGALAWLCPLMAGIMFHRSSPRLIRWGAALSFLLLFTGLMLGQSRFAIVGVLLALFGLIALLVPHGRLRYGALGMLMLVVVFETLLVFNIFTPPSAGAGSAGDEGQTTANLSTRDQNSINTRAEIWTSGLRMIADYPLTGVGMSMFWKASLEIETYLITSVEGRKVPHAHNEWIQVGTDLGLPGLAIYVAWHLSIGYMLFQGWRRGGANQRTIVVAVGGGLLAHAVYGLGDAITLWDRFIYVYYWMLGLAGAQYILGKGKQKI